jgi:hypothetical protein
MCCAALVLLIATALPVASASATSCPNEALRVELESGSLPDCRAYELVTPAYKQGAVVITFAISEDGERILGSSLGAFSDTSDNSLGDGTPLLGATYLFARTGTGWSARALAPPASEYVSDGLFDASANLNESLWSLETPTQPEGVSDLYLERSPGTFIEIGRATPDPNLVNEAVGGPVYRYVGESDNLSHVLFTTPSGFHWPFDATAEGASTLYEYIGAAITPEEGREQAETREPLLVGVLGGANSRSLVSKCGTRLGSSTPGEANGSMYNAVSQTGNRVFFTAVGSDDRECLGGPPAEPLADELFVREEVPIAGGGSEMSSAPISCQPTLTQCADANFEGASLDGSKVFFTSTQSLLPGASEDVSADSATTTGCSQTEPGTSGCNLYEDELSGAGSSLTQKLVLVSNGSPNPRVQGVARISEDGSHIYFVAQGVLTATPNAFGDSAVTGGDNLYVYERDERYPAGHTSFIATLSPEDNGPASEYSGYKGDWARADSRPVLVSREGRFLIFTSVANLIPDEHVSGTARQVYLYDANNETLARASIGQSGYNNNGSTPVYGSKVIDGQGYSYAQHDSPTQTAGVLAPEDGAVFFESPDALTPQALNDRTTPGGGAAPNVYEYHDGNVYQISDGRDTSSILGNPGVALLGSDGSGANVFFTTSDSLVPQDTNTQQDVYDARVEGGIAPPGAPPGCAEDLCQGALGAPTSLPSAGSTAPAEGPPATEPVTVKAKPKPKAAKKRVKAKARKRAKGKPDRHARSRIRR